MTVENYCDLPHIITIPSDILKEIVDVDAANEKRETKIAQLSEYEHALLTEQESVGKVRRVDKIGHAIGMNNDRVLLQQKIDNARRTIHELALTKHEDDTRVNTSIHTHLVENDIIYQSYATEFNKVATVKKATDELYGYITRTLIKIDDAHDWEMCDFASDFSAFAIMSTAETSEAATYIEGLVPRVDTYRETFQFVNFKSEGDYLEVGAGVLEIKLLDFVFDINNSFDIFTLDMTSLFSMSKLEAAYERVSELQTDIAKIQIAIDPEFERLNTDMLNYIRRIRQNVIAEYKKGKY